MQAVETERLRLRMITYQDAAFIQRLYSSEDFLRYIGDKEISNTNWYLRTNKKRHLRVA